MVFCSALKYDKVEQCFTPSLALDPTFGIHSHKTLDTAQPCHFLSHESCVCVVVLLEYLQTVLTPSSSSARALRYSRSLSGRHRHLLEL